MRALVRRTLPFAVTVLAVTSCGTEPAAIPTRAASTTSTTASDSRVAGPVSASTRPTSTKSTADSHTVLGPDGVGRLRLTMSVKAAEATGDVEYFAGAKDMCRNYAYAFPSAPEGGSVLISAEQGIVDLGGLPAMRTPEGIGVGSTAAQVQTAYPRATSSQEDGLDYLNAPVPARSDRTYSFVMKSGTVEEFSLRLNAPNCPRSPDN